MSSLLFYFLTIYFYFYDDIMMIACRISCCL
jgi:hypothetical protein